MADGGATPVVLQTAGMLENEPLVAVSVARTLLTGSLAKGSLASLVLMWNSAVRVTPYGALTGAGTSAQLAVISCVAVTAALAGGLAPATVSTKMAPIAAMRRIPGNEVEASPRERATVISRMSPEASARL